jgi:hypothetical protein
MRFFRFFKYLFLFGAVAMLVASCSKDDDSDGNASDIDTGLALELNGIYVHYPKDSFDSWKGDTFPPMGSSTYYNFRYNCIVTRLKSDTVCSIAYRQSLRPLGSADSAKVFVAEEKAIYDSDVNYGGYGYSGVETDTTVNGIPATRLTYIHSISVKSGSILLRTDYYILYKSVDKKLYEIVMQAPVASDRWSLMNSIVGTYKFTNQ